MEYYPIVKKWRKIKPHLADKTFNEIMVRDFNKYTMGRWNKPFEAGMKPLDFESCDWFCDRPGRMPEYWNYVKHAACHWVVNFNLRLAQLTEPARQWRIVTSQDHSTVWDGQNTLFDMNFLALGIAPEEAYATAKKSGKELKIGQKLVVYYAENYKYAKTSNN